MKHLEERDYYYAIPREGQFFPSSLIRNMKPPKSNLHCSERKRDFKSAAGIAIHNKCCHSQKTEKDVSCEKYGRILSTEATLNNHRNNCTGGKPISNGNICHKCTKTIIGVQHEPPQENV